MMRLRETMTGSVFLTTSLMSVKRYRYADIIKNALQHSTQSYRVNA